VAKFVEPGAPWQRSGVPQTDEAFDLAVLAAWAREIALGDEPVGPFPSVTLPAPPVQVFVTVYADGHIRGCMGSKGGNLREDLGELTRAALADERFDPIVGAGPPEIAVSVSLLYNELEMGDFSREEVRLRYRHGQQALALQQNSRYGILLPLVATRMNLDAEDFVDEVIDKAGITRPPYNWIRFDCVTWLADAEGVWKLDGGFRECGPTLSVMKTAHLQLEYLLRNQRPDGSFYFGYYPFDNTLYQGIDVARQAHAAWILARSGQITAAQAALRWIQAQHADPALALSRDSFALLALCECGDAGVMESSVFAESLVTAIDRHGRVGTWSPPARARENEVENDEDPPTEFDAEELQSYVPGQVLLALAAAARTGLIAADSLKIDRAFRFYRHRFRYRRDFGQVSWLALAFAAWSKLERNHEWAEFVFEIADWILEFQHERTGAFLTDHQPDPPGFTTAVYLEAVGGALDLARWFSGERPSRYENAWHRGFAFLDRLVIQDRDESLLPNSGYASGGVRESLYSGHVRIDFVQHSLAAILEYDPNIFVNNPLRQENQHGEKEAGSHRGSCAAEKEEEAHGTCGGNRATGQEA
jgi:hypothetical protein